MWHPAQIWSCHFVSQFDEVPPLPDGVFPAPGTPVPEPAPLSPQVGIVNYPYTYKQIIGGESLADTHRRFLLSVREGASALEVNHLALINAQELFEVKVAIIQQMAQFDPEGGWGERGATFLLNPHTPTGEETFERLVSFNQQLLEWGTQSEAFDELWNRGNR